MKQLLKSVTVTLLLAIGLALFLPWWSVMVAAFISALLVPLKKAAVFVVPFFTILIFWAIYAYVLGSSNDFILAKKVASLLPLNGNAYLLILVASILGGLAAGLASMLAHQTKSMIK
ncbi:MAG: hypothetical protein HKP28_01440 [Winogradskyella sp.]|nr:hypothetical protein [Winogradskyella sp.]